MTWSCSPWLMEKLRFPVYVTNTVKLHCPNIAFGQTEEGNCSFQLLFLLLWHHIIFTQKISVHLHETCNRQVSSSLSPPVQDSRVQRMIWFRHQCVIQSTVNSTAATKYSVIDTIRACHCAGAANDISSWCVWKTHLPIRWAEGVV